MERQTVADQVVMVDFEGVWSMCTGNIFTGGNMSPLVKVETGAVSWKVGRDLDLECAEFS